MQRQYTGTAGRVENAQVAVYLAYASQAGYAFIDRALYLPRSWTGDPARCAAAGVPDDVAFATKPAQAKAMIIRALDAGTPARWAAGDEVYGADPRLRTELVRRRLGYVLAVAKDHLISTGIGTRRADELTRRLPKRAWQQRSAGTGAKGERFYDWALVEGVDAAADPDRTGRHWLLLRRNRRTGELASYRAYSPTPVSLPALVRVAGTRWQIEESFQSSKELSALDQHQVRRWEPWHRWTILAMLAHAFLSVMTATQPPPDPDSGLIPFTRNEIRRLLTAAVTPAQKALHVLRWSIWRRRHQARSRASHYRRQKAAFT